MCDPVTLIVLGGALAADEVLNDGNIRRDVVNFVIDDVIDPVMTTVSNIIDAALDDPLKAIAQIAAISTGNLWALPLIDGVAVAADGGDIGDILEATAKAYIAQEIGSYAGKAAGTAVGANNAVAAQIVGAGTKAATIAVVYGQDPLQAFITGGASAAVPALLGKVDKFTELPKVAQAAIKSIITAKITNNPNPTAAIMNSMIAASGVVTDALLQFDPDGTKLTPSQHTLLTDVLMGTATAAITGGSPTDAVKAALTKAGNKALGDMATNAFKTATTDVDKTYKTANVVADKMDENIAGQKAAADKYNAVANTIKTKIAKQNLLKDDYTNAISAHNDNPTDTTANTANTAVRAYNDYVTALNKEYSEVLQPQLGKYGAELDTLQKDYAVQMGDYEKAMQAFGTKTDTLSDILDPIYHTSDRAFVEIMNPEFNADEYKKINGLGDDVDPYEHFLNEGQFTGVPTNNKDQTIVEARDKYKEVTGKDLPDYIVERARFSDIDNRDAIVKNYVNTSIKDKAAVEATRTRAATQLLDDYKEAKYPQAKINEKINSGEAQAQVNQIIAAQKKSVEDLRDYAKATLDEYGGESPEYKAAYKTALEAMADVGGYDVTKDGDKFVDAHRGEIDPDTLVSTYKEGLDPVTGVPWIEIVWKPGTSTSKPTEQDKKVPYSALLAIGKSANPPSDGGAAVFGDGTGVSSGIFGFIMPIAFDDGSGNSGVLYKGDSGFSLIAYSNGKSVVVRDTALTDAEAELLKNAIPIDLTERNKILAEVPVVKEKTPEEKEALKAKLNEPPPPTIADAKKTITDTTSKEIAAGYQTAEKVTAALKAAGYNPTDEEIAKMTGEKSAEQLTQEAKEYASPRVVDEDEARAAYAEIGIKKPTTDDLKKIMGQYDQSDLPNKAKANLDNARYNSIIAQLDELTIGASPDTLNAIALVKADLENQLKSLGYKIDDVSTDVQTKYDALTAEQKALADKLTKQGIDLNTAIDTAKNELAGKIDDVSTDVKVVADLVGKPASQVTQDDIDYVKQFLKNGGDGQPDLTYDYNGDGIVDANDQSALEGIFSGTGDGSPSTPATGSKWAPTGVFKTTQDEAEATRQANAADAEKTRQANAARTNALAKSNVTQAQKTQQMGNVNNLMNMLGQAEDTGGQQNTVKAADPAKIGYIYDWNSIFANPAQQNMFVSPYAKGGLVDDVGDVNDELIKILKG